MSKKVMTLESLGDIRKPKRTEPIETTSELLKRKTRTRRRSQRTMQLNLKVTPEFYSTLCRQADEEENYMVDVLEKALASYINRQ